METGRENCSINAMQSWCFTSTQPARNWSPTKTFPDWSCVVRLFLPIRRNVPYLQTEVEHKTEINCKQSPNVIHISQVICVAEKNAGNPVRMENTDVELCLVTTDCMLSLHLRRERN